MNRYEKIAKSHRGGNSPESGAIASLYDYLADLKKDYDLAESDAGSALFNHFLAVDVERNADGQIVLARWQVTVGGPHMEYRYSLYDGFSAVYANYPEKHSEYLSRSDDEDLVTALAWAAGDDPDSFE